MRWHSNTFDRKADASRWLSEQLANLNRGQWVDPSAGRLAFGAFADNWLKAKTRVKRKTLYGYGRCSTQGSFRPSVAPHLLASTRSW
jgi:hypothetical protein